MIILPAYPNLIFVGEVNVRSVLVKAYAAMPRRIRNKPVRILQKTKEEINGHDGWYNHKLSQIWLSNTCSLSTGIHELGHFYHESILDPFQSQDWTSFWKAHKDLLPTDYARTNDHEGFAECWEYYFYKPSLLKKLFGPKLDSKVKAKLKTYF